jgi:hypothetical protein
VAAINEKYLKAAKVVGKLMRDLRCSDLFNLRKFYLSMVFSQLYGLSFVNASKIEFERGVGIFLKTSLGLPTSFPHVVAVSILDVRHVKLVQMETRSKSLSRWESVLDNPVFDALYTDRLSLFPIGCGLNASLGDSLVEMGISPTIDFKTHAPAIISTTRERLEVERRQRLLETEGRALWTELGAEGRLHYGLKRVLSRISYESTRIVLLLFADMLCWTSLKKSSRICPTCKTKFTTCHFFSCSKLFPHEQAWRILIQLCRTESWEDVVDLIFAVLSKWVEETPWFRPDFKLHVQSFQNLCRDPNHCAFRWNFY